MGASFQCIITSQIYLHNNMDWTDQAFVLGARRHGESSAVVQLLTLEHGRHAGLINGHVSISKRGLTEPGNFVQATWRGRLPEHLGRVKLEVIKSYSSLFLNDPGRLSALSSACAVAEMVLPERQIYPEVFNATRVLMDSFNNNDNNVWLAVYVYWELGLLKEIGFGLDLMTCAATGVITNLTCVSPKTGRAVSQEAGLKYHSKLLKLPSFLLDIHADKLNISISDIKDGLTLTGYFLTQHVFNQFNRKAPGARERLIYFINNKF